MAIPTTVIGAAGRMGRELVRYAVDCPDFELAGAVEAPGHDLIGTDAGTVAGTAACGVFITDDLKQALTKAEAVIAFADADSAIEQARAASEAGCAVVIGTTGLKETDKHALESLAADGARIVFAPNMSVGVNLLFHLCRKVAPALGPAYDIEVVEMHHNRKKDAPSGTAVRLGEILAEASGVSYPEAVRHGREGMVGARTDREIGMHAVRGGDVVGDHTVIFATEGERVELTHKASSRQTFVKGAYRAVSFLAGAQPGLYDMQDVLGLS